MSKNSETETDRPIPGGMTLGEFKSEIHGLDLKQPYPDIPDDEMFESEGKEYLAAEDLEEIAEMLIASKFPHLYKRVRIEYRWKRSGGGAVDKPVLGKCAKLGAATRIFTNKHFLVWLAADHLREAKFTRLQVQALLFHELCHAAVENDKAYTVGHDYAGFVRELKEYGAWKLDLIDMTRVAQQLELPGVGETPPAKKTITVKRDGADKTH